MSAYVGNWSLWLIRIFLMVCAVSATAQSVPIGNAARQPLPASVRDIATLLHSYRLDVNRVQRLRAELDAPVPADVGPTRLAIVLHQKAMVAEELQEVDRRVRLLQDALKYASQDADAEGGQVGSQLRIRSELGGALRPAQGVVASLQFILAFAVELESNRGQNLPWLLGAYRQLGTLYLQLGDFQQAKLYLARLETVVSELAPGRGAALRLPQWMRQLESLRAELNWAQGRLTDAENAYLEALKHGDAAIRLLPARQQRGLFASPLQRAEAAKDDDQLRLAGIYLDQSRVDEAELMLRDILKRTLLRDGRNSLLVGKSLSNLAKVMLHRGRAADAVELAQWAEETYDEAGLAPLSTPRASGRVILANALVVAGRPQDAVQIIDELRTKLKDDSRLEEGFGGGTLQSVRAYAAVGRLNEALRDAEHVVRRNAERLGNAHYDTAEARGYRAMVLWRMGQGAVAAQELEQATRILLDTGKLSGKQQSSTPRGQRLKLILGDYLSLLVGKESARSSEEIAKAFMLADVARWQSVQKAVTGAAIRSSAANPALALRIKRVQDADDEMQALYKSLISLHSAPPQQQLPVAIKELEARLDGLRRAMDADLSLIRREYPQYDGLVNPRAVDIQAARNALRTNEAMLSLYVSPQGTYVWGLNASGQLHFHFSEKSTAWIADRVRRLRASVDLTTPVSPDSMQFDLVAGAELYAELLAPVAAAWNGANTLVVIANDVLGQIPFSMLPMTVSMARETVIQGQAQAFREIPWLLRQVAIAYAPSVSSFVTLRSTPPPSANRKPFIGFGDPDFGAGPAASSSRAMARGAAGFAPQAMLAPLPDTRDEILAVAQALSANVERDTYFGARANPAAVAQADLINRRVIAFATHGLVAGELPGVDQPALALSPGAGRPLQEGLLRLEDILRLNMDADLVVLSACNTAASDGAGSEAVSGLGRGFFHAGARSVLATHWPVESVSATELVARMFRQYAANPQLSRAQALRQAMLHVLDYATPQEGVDNRRIAYAHPAFWAPYALYGDPAR